MAKRNQIKTPIYSLPTCKIRLIYICRIPLLGMRPFFVLNRTKLLGISRTS